MNCQNEIDCHVGVGGGCLACSICAGLLYINRPQCLTQYWLMIDP